MELERYRALLTAVETGSLTAAAQKLQYTPSGVSRMIAALEAENGFPLLCRDRSGVRPTAECERLLPAVRELLHAGESCEQISAQVRGLNIGTVMVGTAYSAFYPPLVRIISKFHAEYPGIQVLLSGGFSTELTERLNGREIDICIVSRREGNHCWTPVLQDEMMAWLPAEHPLASLDALPVDAFAREPYIETYPNQDIDNRRIFARCGVSPNQKFATNDSLATYFMVEAGLGLSMNNAINGRMFSGNVRMLPLDPPQLVEIGVASLPDASPAAQCFLHAMLAELSQGKNEQVAEGEDMVF